ncbi:MAG: hypothetical protein WAV41_05440 [Microgenomates group bacterium]
MAGKKGPRVESSQIRAVGATIGKNGQVESISTVIRSTSLEAENATLDLLHQMGITSRPIERSKNNGKSFAPGQNMSQADWDKIFKKGQSQN